MKLRKIIFSLIVIIMLISCITIVNATEVSAKLTPSATIVKKGETFTVTISAACSDGVSTFSTTIQYDKNVLELVNKTVTDTNNWRTEAGRTENEINILTNKADKVTQDDLYIMTFKVKDTAQTGNTIISAGDISIDSDAESNSLHIIDGEIIIINVSESGALNVGGQATLTEVKIETPPAKTIYNAGEKFSTAGMVIKAVYSNGTEKEITDYKYSPSGELSTSSTKITITYTENGVTKTATQNITVNSKDVSKDGEDNTTNNNIVNKDNTVAKNEIADTGLEDNMGIIFVAIAILGLSSYIQYKKYKNI